MAKIGNFRKKVAFTKEKFLFEYTNIFEKSVKIILSWYFLYITFKKHLILIQVGFFMFSRTLYYKNAIKNKLFLINDN